MTLDREALLARIMSTQSVSRHTKVMSQLIVELATEMGAAAHIDAAGNVYATKGLATHYPCLVAHTDTVHDIIPVGNFSIHRSPDGLLFAWDSLHARQTGIGGDDKVGIYIALSIMDELPACKCAFFRDEEIGCLGAGLANLEFFEDCAFAIEADRRGYGDVIRHAGSTELHGDEFANALKPYLKEYGYANAFGMMTDVQRLKEKGLTIAAANFSCGYYEPHTRYEYIDKAQMEQTRAMLLAICQELATQTWAHVSPTASHQTYGYGLDTRGGTHTKFAWLEHDTWCDLCDEESLGLVYCSTYDGFLCPLCVEANKQYNWRIEEGDNEDPSLAGSHFITGQAAYVRKGREGLWIYTDPIVAQREGLYVWTRVKPRAPRNTIRKRRKKIKQLQKALPLGPGFDGETDRDLAFEERWIEASEELAKEEALEVAYWEKRLEECETCYYDLSEN
jgi:tripeptide aminopeptidase